MALDRASGQDFDRTDDTQADDTRDPRTPAMGGKGQRQAAHDDNRDDDGDDTAELRVKAATAKANAEAKKYRLEAKELRERLESIEAAQREAEEATLPELDKARKRIEKYEADLSERQADLEAIASAYDALQVKFAAFEAMDGKVRPDRRNAALRQLDLDAIERDDETGAPIGLDKTVDAILKEFPEWSATGHRAGTPPVPSGGGTPPRRPVGGGGGGNPVDRATDQLAQTGRYTPF